MVTIGLSGGIVFLSLPSFEMAVQRVAEREHQGGHDIPESTIRRRYDAGRRLFAEVHQPLMAQWVIYDYAGDEPLVMAWNDKP